MIMTEKQGGQTGDHDEFGFPDGYLSQEAVELATEHWYFHEYIPSMLPGDSVGGEG